MNQTPVRVTIRDGTVTIRFPARLIRSRLVSSRRRSAREDRRAFKAVEGILKGRKPDGLTYQRKVRREWD